MIFAPSDVDEEPLDGEAAAETAVRLAYTKARLAGPTREGDAIVAADTIVVLDGKQLGKPVNVAEARNLLRSLRGRTHEVITGIAVVGSSQEYQRAVSTLVHMRHYSDEELQAFAASGRAMDKAGGYAIQDADFAPVASVDGCYLNVVGLPLCEVARGLRGLGWQIGDEEDVATCLWCVLGRTALESAP